jgi:tRNA pseudouridine38-40 synthase
VTVKILINNKDVKIGYSEYTRYLDMNEEDINKVFHPNYKISKEDFNKLNELLKLFIGTKSYHNYTKRLKLFIKIRGSQTTKDSYKRHITQFFTSEPYMIKDIECLTIIIVGQSFMIHQIRKMIGMIIAIMRGYFKFDNLNETFDKVFLTPKGKIKN